MANQPWFISSTKRTGRLEQCWSSVCGFMSSMLTMRPSSAMNAADSGSTVLRIQKHCTSACSKANSMPSLGASTGRNISPVARSSCDCATSARMTWMPALRAIVGSGGCAVWAGAAPAQARAAAQSRARTVWAMG